MRAHAHHSQDTGTANPVRLDLTAWRLIDGRLLVTPHGAPAALMDAPDFTPAKFEEPKLLPPAPRKALPAPREAKVKKARKIVKKAVLAKAAAAVAKASAAWEAKVRKAKAAALKEHPTLTCQACGKQFPKNRGLPAKRCPECRAKQAEKGKQVRMAAPAPKRSAPSTLIPENTTSRAARPGVHMTVPRRCDDCGAKTDEDPCHACKAPWKRTR